VAGSPGQLTLIVPGLTGPRSDPPVTDYLQPRPAALDRLLSRSRCERVPGQGLDAALCRVFGIVPEAALPVAALTWLADCGTPVPAALLRADPVHLRADQRYLRLFDAHSVPLRADEADRLVATINEYHVSSGWQLYAPDPQRWYLVLPQAPAIQTHAPQRAAGADIDPFLPAGIDGIRWHAIMNELQMLLHDHPVNEARAARGEPAINSLWFWGNGILPERITAPAAAISADHPVARGLALHAGILCKPLPGNFAQWLDSGTTLVVLDALEWPQCYRDMDGWLDRFEQLEQDWLRPAALAMQGGRLSTLTIECCNGNRFGSGRWQRHAFWKPLRNFEEVVAR
jgi:hypothetical protein